MSFPAATAFEFLHHSPSTVKPANEALDCRVYAYAALAGLFHLGLKLNTRAMLIESEPDKVLHPARFASEEKTSLRLPGAIIQEAEPPTTKSIASRLA
ncbi:TPA: hypothetical protein ACPZCJ_001567 [Yersinia enterocolitica]